MDHQRKKETFESEKGFDQNEAGPSQRLALALPGSEKPETVSDVITSLEEGKNDPIVGHYWVRFTDKIKSRMSESAQQCEETLSNLKETPLEEEMLESYELFCESQALENLPILGSSEVKTFFEKVERRDEYDAGSSLLSSSTDSHSEILTIDKGSDEIETESMSTKRNINERQGGTILPAALGETFSTKQPVIDEFHISNVQEDTDKQISTTSIRTTKDETRVNEQEHSATKSCSGKEENASTAKSKYFSRSLSCGKCDSSFGQFDVLRRLLYKQLKEEWKKVYKFKCHICSKILKDNQAIQKHIVMHFRANDLYCVKCQSISVYGNVIYDIESEGPSLQVTPFVETQKLAEKTRIRTLERSFAEILSKISLRCKKCENKFGDANKFLRLYQYDSSSYNQKRINNIYCCILCGTCRKIMSSIENHLLQHFQSKSVHCKKCYESLQTQNIPEISTTQEVEASEARTIKNFNKYLKINCEKCNGYLADSAVLKPRAVILYELFIIDDKLKIISNVVYRCIICHSDYSMSETENHVTGHITSKHIRCATCFYKYPSSIAFIDTIIPQCIPSKINIRCSGCSECFREKDLQLTYKEFFLRTALQGRDFVTKQTVFVCEFCNEAYFRKSSIIRHVSEHISKRETFCSFCTIQMEEKQKKV